MTYVEYQWRQYQEKKFGQSIKEYTIAATICNVILLLFVLCVK